MASVLVLHNSDYAGHIDKLFDGTMKRIDIETFEVEVDVSTDVRSTWFFKGLSAERANRILRVISCCSEHPYGKDDEMTEEALRGQTVPYDDMTFEVGGEELQVLYSIRDIETSKLRRAIVGPQGIALYEKDIPHFGPILVYKCTQTERENEDSSLTVMRRMLPIQSDIAAIHRALRQLNFGG